ncbi:twin-arginine translocase subunit TatC [Paenibacillus sp. NPDC056579]|uniref:twin-arginine translocase subunit TatC n=1 Tax=unclassified Paenibacillus TaxID=185978 RepID=UPI001EF7E2EB|nr:twin-arginine translocase subunit TatC [Paenibacillus sp. H1-7]ULL13108.1 twin-arginine translocase subunit TatC [Paenibacillus sp. H1-7]
MEEDGKMALWDHVAELRKRIILVMLALVVTLIAGLFIAPRILLYLKGVPPASGISWNVFSPWDAIRIYMSIALAFAIAVTMPFALYQLWKFVNKGLRREEQDAALKYIPFTVLCFVIGFSFAYFIVFPMSFSFTTGIARSLQFTETYGISQYFGFMFSIVIPLAVAFELPVIVMFLTKIGILNPKRLHTMRRYAYLVLVIVASLISPPELISHLMVAVPLIVLYEISVWLSRVVYRNKLRLQQSGSLEQTA